MITLLIGVLLFLSPADSTASLDECLQTDPESYRVPITSLSDARETWIETRSVSRDTLLSHLSRIKQTRECYHDLTPSRIERPYIENVVRTYKIEAELRAALRQFPQAFEAYEAGLSYLRSQSSDEFVDYDETYTVWPERLYQDMGYLHYLLGNLSSSIENYLHAYESAHTLRGRVGHLLNVGILHQRAQDYSSARHYYRRARTWLNSDSADIDDRSDLLSRMHSVRADLLLEKTLNADFDPDELAQARDYAERARARAERGTDQFARVTAILSESLGYLGQFEKAYRLNREVRQYARSHDASLRLTFSLLKLGVLHIQTENWTRADSSLQDALGLARNLEDLDSQRRILRAQGRLYEMQERWTDAADAYRKAVSVVEEYRESLTASQWSMSAFSQWRDVHRGLVRALLASNRPREALTVLDRSRARHLEDLRTQARVSNQLPPRERARLDSLSGALSDVRNQLGDASLPDSVEADLRTREASLMAARQQLLRLDPDTARPSLDSVSTALRRQDRTLVSYFLDDPWPVYDRQPRSVAFVLTGDTLRTVPLPELSQDSVQVHVEQTSPLFTSRGKPDRMNAMHFDLRPLRTLHEAVYEPVRPHLPEDTPLTVIPDGPLFHAPFSMLVDSMPGGRFAPAEARYVLHERATSLELASSLIADDEAVHDWSTFEPQLAAYGVSNFDTLETVPSALQAALPEAAQDSSVRLPPLPGVRQELSALESSVADADVAVNSAATERAFCRDARRAGILHVASHAFVNASSPLQNAILLRSSGSSSGNGSDGVLFLHELQSQRSQIPLVVLSGCSTAKGTLRGGEGMEGLQYAFRAMGAQSTVSTLWPVDDEASVELMQGFYSHLDDGLSKDRALRQAQLDYLSAHPEKASPFFWAPPVLYGAPDALPLSSSSGLPGWAWPGLLGGGVLFFLALLAWWRDQVPAAFSD